MLISLELASPTDIFLALILCMGRIGIKFKFEAGVGVPFTFAAGVHAGVHAVSLKIEVSFALVKSIFF